MLESVPRGQGHSEARLVLVDQRDSFTWNLAHLCAAAGLAPRVLAATALDLRGLLALAPTHVILGPGPGHPASGALALELLRAAPPGLALLGVCLGHQQLGLAAGARIVRAHELVHGWTSAVRHDGRGVFRDLPMPLSVARYHSLVVQAKDCPQDLEISATTSDGEIMGLRWRRRAFEGVQFHPESVLAEHGRQLLSNFIEIPWRGADRAPESTAATVPHSSA
jgi:anthranilate synthase component 2